MIRASDLRRAYPRPDGRLPWSAVLGVELVASFLLLALLGTMAAHFGATAMAKARIADIWPDFRAYRAEIVEQMAVTGVGLSVEAPATATTSAGAGDERANQPPAADDIETALAFRRPTLAAKSDARAAPSVPAGGGLAAGLLAGATKRAQSESRKFTSEVIDRSVVFRLDLGGNPHVLAITPAAIGQGIPGSLLWLCGQRQPPPGWYRLPGPSGSDLPNELSYSVCRDHRTF